MDFKEILDFESIKLLNLFNLLKSNENSCSLKQLSNEVGINSKTIQRSLVKLQKLFKRYQLDQHLTICANSKKYIYLKKDNAHYVETFLVRYLSNLPEIVFLKAIIEEENILMKQLAERSLIGESSMRKRMKKINEWLKKFNIQLTRGTYEFKGNEEQIRAMIFHFYWFVYQGTETKFLLNGKNRSKCLTEQFILFFQIQINDLQKKGLYRMIQIASWRYQKGNKVQIRTNWKQYIENSSIFLKFMKAMRMEQMTKHLPFEELAYLYLISQAYFFQYYESRIQAYIIEEHYLRQTSCFYKTLIAAHKFRRVFWNNNFTYSMESVNAFLGFHLHYELVSNISFERNQPIKALQECYPSFSSKLEEGISELVKESPCYRNIPKESLFHRYFMILSSRIPPVYNEKKIVVCLMTDLPLEIETQLGKRINTFFLNKFNLAVIYARISRNISYSDIILTTVLCQEVEQKYNLPTLLIEPEFSEEGFIKIEKILKKVRK